jgi:hypothetical protein
MRPVCKADKITTFMCRLSSKSGSLSLLEPSGPVQACNGIAVPFTFSQEFHNSLQHVCLLSHLSQGYMLERSETEARGYVPARGMDTGHAKNRSLIQGGVTSALRPS